jgi:hypothetical protein
MNTLSVRITARAYVKVYNYFNNVESTDTDTDTYNLSLKLGWDAQGTLWPQMNPEMLKK